MTHTREEWKIVGKRAAMVAAGLTALWFLAWATDDGKPHLTHDQQVILSGIQMIEWMREAGVAMGQAYCPVVRPPETPFPIELAK